MKTPQKVTIVLEVTTEKVVPNLGDHAVGRVYTLDGVAGCKLVSLDAVDLPIKVPNAQV